VFPSQYPLLTIIRPDVVNDTVNSLMQQAELSGNGYLARGEILGAAEGQQSFSTPAGWEDALLIVEPPLR